MQPSVKWSLLFLAGVLPWCSWGCSVKQTEQVYTPYIAKTFDSRYDQVWGALESIMVDDLMLPIKEKNKQRGIIQTDWISVIRIRGTFRWSIETHLERAGDKTLVKVYRQVEEPAPVVGTMKKKGKMKTGWQKSTIQITEPEDILTKLGVRLGNQPAD